MQLRERIVKNILDADELRVYPHLPIEMADMWMASAGHVAALRYWDSDGQPVWGIQININYSEPLTREKTDQLQAAINRCWEWIDEQSA